MTSPAPQWSQDHTQQDGYVPNIQTENMNLKVHYIFDKLEQSKCLARLPQLIPVQCFPVDERTVVGMIDINWCLTAVAQGSPELINAVVSADSTVDYAVYIHDYTEPDAPLVGHGMLSRLLPTMNSALVPQEPIMVSGLVTKNMLTMFSKHNTRTLEIRMKFSESPRMPQQQPPPPSLPEIVAPQPIRQDVAVPLPETNSPVPHLASEWHRIVKSNPQLAVQISQLPLAEQTHAFSLEMAKNSQAQKSTQNKTQSLVNTSFTVYKPQPQSIVKENDGAVLHLDSRPQSTAIPESSREKTVLETAPLSDAPSSRPSSRSSRKRAPSGRPRGRPRKVTSPSEHNGNTSGYEDGTDDDPPLKRRAITTMATNTKSVNTPFASAPESLRVAASTSGSLRSFRPIACMEPSAPGNIQDVPRAPTPIPFAEKRPRASVPLRCTSTLNQEHSVRDDSRPPNDQPLAAVTPNSEASTPDFGSSPPMPRTAQFLRPNSAGPSSPVLPPMPIQSNDSGFVSGGNDDPEDHQTTPRPNNVKCRDLNVPVHIFHMNPESGPPPSRNSQNKRKKKTSSLRRAHAGPMTNPAAPISIAPLRHEPKLIPHSSAGHVTPVNQGPVRTLKRSESLPGHCSIAPRPLQTSVGSAPQTPSLSHATAERNQVIIPEGHVPLCQQNLDPGLSQTAQHNLDIHVSIHPPFPELLHQQPHRSHSYQVTDTQRPSPLDLNISEQQSHIRYQSHDSFSSQHIDIHSMDLDVMDMQLDFATQQQIADALASSEIDFGYSDQGTMFDVGDDTTMVINIDQALAEDRAYQMQQGQLQNIQLDTNVPVERQTTDIQASNTGPSGNDEPVPSSQKLLPLSVKSTQDPLQQRQQSLQSPTPEVQTTEQLKTPPQSQLLSQHQSSSKLSYQQEQPPSSLMLPNPNVVVIPSVEQAPSDKSQAMSIPLPVPTDQILQENGGSKSVLKRRIKKKVPVTSISAHPTGTFSEAPHPPSDSPMAHYASGPATSPPPNSRANKNYVRKEAIKDKLEQAINNGEMPPFCLNCGAIETPTWRKIYVKEFSGTPEYHEYSDKPGRVTAIEVTSRGEDGQVTRYRMLKKALGPDDVRCEWKDDILCNPCGIWLCKNNKQRPPDRWENDAHRLGQERRKRGTGRAPVRKRKPSSVSSASSQKAGNSTHTTTSTDNLSVPASHDTIDLMSPILERTASASNAKNSTSGIKIEEVPVELRALCQPINAPSVPDSTMSGNSSTAPTPEVEDFDSMGRTRRLLFPTQSKGHSHDPQSPTHGGSSVGLSPNQDGSHSTDRNDGVSLVTTRSYMVDDMTAIFRSPHHSSAPRPSTPTQLNKPVEFKTPSRVTPNHRPVTRSVSKSIQSERAQNNDQPPQTPSRTPRGSAINMIRQLESPTLRRSPRINKGVNNSARKHFTPHRSVEASVSDINAALSAFNESFRTDTPAQSAGNDDSAKDPNDLSPMLRQCLGENWSPSKDWAQMLDMNALANMDHLSDLFGPMEGDAQSRNTKNS